MSSASFKQFPRLPTELQILIFKYAGASASFSPAQSTAEPNDVSRMMSNLAYLRSIAQAPFGNPDFSIVEAFFRFKKPQPWKPHFKMRFILMATSVLARQAVLEAWKEDIIKAEDDRWKVERDILLEFLDEQLVLASRTRGEL